MFVKTSDETANNTDNRIIQRKRYNIMHVFIFYNCFRAFLIDCLIACQNFDDSSQYKVFFTAQYRPKLMISIPANC